MSIGPAEALVRAEPATSKAGSKLGGFVRRWEWPLSIAAMVAALAVFQFLVPGDHRLLCPSCEGLRHVGGSFWTDLPEGAASEPEIAEDVQGARDRIRSAWPELASEPTVVVCTQDECWNRFGAGAHTVGLYTYRFDAVAVRPDWRQEGDGYGVLAHEMVHAEVARRLGRGPLAFWPPAVPTWFEEGLAVVVGNGRGAYGDWWELSALDRVLRLTSVGGWRAGTNVSLVEGNRMYGAAAAIVGEAVKRVGLRAAVGIVDSVGAGATFGDAWRAAVGASPEEVAASVARRMERQRTEEAKP